ncbi:hypothetical protein ACFQX9_22640 [Bradyrhizobium sp. GCM10028915]|uniref:hypothetical protein n=1 Tax=Bradyrhizobium sp. GCM10028915 TaxID=3273385 RepID=UPI0036174518
MTILTLYALSPTPGAADRDLAHLIEMKGAMASAQTLLILMRRRVPDEDRLHAVTAAMLYDFGSFKQFDFIAFTE